jgi:hypothetical protein
MLYLLHCTTLGRVNDWRNGLGGTIRIASVLFGSLRNGIFHNTNGSTPGSNRNLGLFFWAHLTLHLPGSDPNIVKELIATIDTTIQ